MEKEIVFKIEIPSNEYNLFEGTLANIENFEKLARLFNENDKMTPEIYEKIKDDYLKYSYEHKIIKEALIEKYAPTEKWSTYTIFYPTKEIFYYK